MKAIGNYFKDCRAMFLRNFKLSLRSPEALFMCIAMPALMMWMFVSLFGGAMNKEVLGGLEYVNFVLPAILILTIGQTASGVSISVNVDMQRGIIDRFLSMPIYRTSILFGQAITTMIKSVISCAIVLVIAFALGFRPVAGVSAWLSVAALTLFIMFAFTWLFILLGIIVRSTEVAGLLMVAPMILPYFSTGFAPAEAMPLGLAWFARYQPLTPMIETLRALFLGAPLSRADVFAAVLWTAGIFVLSFSLCVFLLHKRTRK